MKEGFWTHKNSTGRKQAVKITHLQTCSSFHEKERMTQSSGRLSPAESLEDYTQALTPNGEKYNPYPLDFRTIMDQ